MSIMLAQPTPIRDNVIDWVRALKAQPGKNIVKALERAHGGSMDLTVPYTFYPIALPHWIAWMLFLLAMLGAAAVGMLWGRERGWLRGVLAGILGAIGFLVATMVASMVITFFVHDQ